MSDPNQESISSTAVDEVLNSPVQKDSSEEQDKHDDTYEDKNVDIGSNKEGVSEDMDKNSNANGVEIGNKEVNEDWDHSNRRVIIYGVLKYLKNSDIPKMVKKWLSLHPDPSYFELTKWKKAPNGSWVVLTCKTETMANDLITYFTTNKVTNERGGELTAVKSNNPEEKRKRGDDDDDPRNHKRKNTGVLSDDEVRDKLIPFWRHSYPDQLELKLKNMIKKCAMRICSETKKKFINLQREAKHNSFVKPVKMYSWLNANRSISMNNVIQSPKQHAYRNKNEFTFGYMTPLKKEGDAETKQIPSIGFLAAGWSGEVSRPHVCTNVPWEACAVVDVVHEFLQTSQFHPYDSKNHNGLWRILTIRSSRRTSECMIIIQHASPSHEKLDCSDEESLRLFQQEQQKLVTLLTENDLPPVDRSVEIEDPHFPLRVTSIFFQEYHGLSTPPPEHPVQHAFGKTCLTEKLGPCTFQISPGAFFQVNTEAAELLYQVVVEKVREVSQPELLLFDVCCGTGSIGITCLKEGVASKVVGVDISSPAIVDANINTKVNELLESNIRFIASKAEAIMSHETSKLKHESKDQIVVAVVDPAREGLHPDVIRAIRMTETIDRLIYVSCNPTGSLIQDASTLCAPPSKRFKGRAFRPTFAQPVDMFPETDHCEMVMVFDRLTEEELNG
jgi:tRNA (uracil-5-)-methyltransferase